MACQLLTRLRPQPHRRGSTLDLGFTVEGRRPEGSRLTAITRQATRLTYQRKERYELLMRPSPVGWRSPYASATDLQGVSAVQGTRRTSCSTKAVSNAAGATGA